MSPVPHDSWARFYDFVQEESFGGFLDELSTQTFSMIEPLLPVSGRILDIGAGTGRLSIPLAQRGHQVSAIEPSGEMLAVLRSRADAAGINVTTQQQTAQSFEPVAATDLIVAVFTVMNYLLDEDALRALATRVRASLATTGSFVFDLAGSGLFHDASYQTQAMTRTVTITPLDADRFRYDEYCEGEFEGERFAYSDSFQIRHWEPEYVLALMAEEGLALVEDHSEEMVGSASGYLRMGPS